MLSVTKIVYFEMAHAIHGYTGDCQNIHGHSYELRVTVFGRIKAEGYIPFPGFVVDFKELKRLITQSVIQKMDHKLVVSKAYIDEHSGISSQKNLLVLEVEPTAENLLIFIQQKLTAILPSDILLGELVLYETKDSFVRWSDAGLSFSNTFLK